MTPIMFYDFETSGLPLWSERSTDPRQPHIVQAAAALVDEESRETISSINLIVRPHDWEIPENVAAVHGITTDFARRVGVAESSVVESVWDFFNICGYRVGHNESFDARIMRIALKRFLDDPEAERWKEGGAACTANAATPIVNLPPTPAMIATGRNHPKRCKLEEAYEFFFGKPMENAHSAMGDVQATMEVYWALKDREGVREKAPTSSDAVDFLG